LIQNQACGIDEVINRLFQKGELFEEPIHCVAPSASILMTGLLIRG
jgi:hypothetical protein